MTKCLGFDTSNYTTSIALASEDEYVSKRKILDVNLGERGLRQSDALFLHTRNMPDLISEIEFGENEIKCIAVSDKPRDEEGSYMPCFLCGVNAANVASKVLDLPLYAFSHQAGHIMAACKTSSQEGIINKEFLSYHISGGSSELVHVLPDKDKGFKVEVIGGTKDLSIGQLIDRCGVYLKYKFPCGSEMEKSINTELKDIKVKTDCGYFNCSGIENKVIQMIKEEKTNEDIINYVFSYSANIIVRSIQDCLNLDKYKNLPVVLAGGVMRNVYIRNYIKSRIEKALFGSIELSSDNAVGIAWLGLYKEGGMLG